MRGRKQPGHRDRAKKPARLDRAASRIQEPASPAAAWGQERPEDLPGYFFPAGTILDYGATIPADISRQNFGIGHPRGWYIAASIRCRRCGQRFRFSAPEQKHWYEDLGFNVGALAIRCRDCRHTIRRQAELRREYERNIKAALLKSAPPELKSRMVDVIDQLVEGDATRTGVHEIDAADARHLGEHRRILAQQLARPT